MSNQLYTQYTSLYHYDDHIVIPKNEPRAGWHYGAADAEICMLNHRYLQTAQRVRSL